MSIKTANGELDPEAVNAAIAHAGVVRRTPEVKCLLEQMGCPDLLAGFGDPVDPELYRGMDTVLRALVRAGAGSLWATVPL